MDAHRPSTREIPQQKRRQGLATDTWPFQCRRHVGWSRGVGPLGLIGLLGLLGWGVAPPQALEPSSHVTRLVPYGQLPLSFEVNQGQTDGQGYTLFLTAREAVFAFSPAAVPVQHPTGRVPGTGTGQDTPDTALAVVRMQLLGANPVPQVTGLEERAGKVHYVRGNDPQQWQMHVPTYAKVHYTAVYPGIDLVYYGQPRQLEYAFRIVPGTDPTVITLGFAGIDRIDVDAQGDLVLATAGRSLRFQKSVIYQEGNGPRHAVAGSYVCTGPHQVGFHVAAYDPARPLVIDPVLSYATYLGGSGVDNGNSIAVDASGAVYVTGSTNSPDFPTVHPLQPTLHSGFVAKLTADGSALVYATYLGGSGFDFGTGIAVDAAGAAYVTGLTHSPDFPTMPGAFQVTSGTRECSPRGVDQNAFVVKLASPTFAGTPGTANRHGESVSALVHQYGSLEAAASALGFPSVQAPQDAIQEFCEG
jgi:Beta-propeller repeat